MLKKLFGFTFGTYLKYPFLTLWPSNSAEESLNTYGSHFKYMAAEDVCQNKLSINKLKEWAMEGEMLNKLEERFGELESYSVRNLCTAKCCKDMVNQTFFSGIIDIGNIFSSAYKHAIDMGVGSFMAHLSKRVTDFLGK